jgi:hypothetical protein
VWEAEVRKTGGGGAIGKGECGGRALCLTCVNQVLGS